MERERKRGRGRRECESERAETAGGRRQGDKRERAYVRIGTNALQLRHR